MEPELYIVETLDSAGIFALVGEYTDQDAAIAASDAAYALGADVVIITPAFPDCG